MFIDMSRFAAVLLVSLAVSAAAQSQGSQQGTSASPIQSMLEQGALSPIATVQIDPGPVSRFYALRGYQPAWTGLGNERVAEIALQVISNAAADGLVPDDYHLGDLVALARSRSPEARVEYDILLSASLLHYEADVRSGRIALYRVDKDVSLPAVVFDAASETQNALTQGHLAEFLAQLPPPQPEYSRLRDALANYRAMEAKGGWPVLVSANKIELEAGDPAIAELRTRLAAEYPLPAAQEDPKNAALRETLRAYQWENGLQPDGIAGARTLAALNVPVGDRISQIVANMERWRWVPRDFGSRYIEVNVPDASLVAVQNGKVVLFSRVIVGKPSTRTPIVEAVVTGVTVNPYWKVPDPIAREELLPRIAGNPNYLIDNNMVRDDNGQIRQLPGPNNALGSLKLELPNRFNVYLHDTPAKQLFARDRRYFSHGCIRVEQIQSLASFAMTGDVNAGIAPLQAGIVGGTTDTVPLSNPLPVFVLYWTAIGTRDGRAGFRPDIYGRDRRLLAALVGQHAAGRTAMNSTTECSASAG